METDARTSAIVSASRGYNSPEDKNDETVDNKFSAASFWLRRLRKIIYDKATLNSDADKDLKKYGFQVRKFVKNFRENLTKKEIKIWKNKIRRTESDVRELKKKHSQNTLNDDTDEEVTITTNAKAPDNLEQDDDMTKVNKVDINYDNEAFVVSKEDALNPSIRDMFDIKAYKDVCSNLPPAPTDLDVEIEEKLQKLKVFNKVWLDEVQTVEEVLDSGNIGFEQLTLCEIRVLDCPLIINLPVISLLGVPKKFPFWS